MSGAWTASTGQRDRATDSRLPVECLPVNTPRTVTLHCSLYIRIHCPGSQVFARSNGAGFALLPLLVCLVSRNKVRAKHSQTSFKHSKSRRSRSDISGSANVRQAGMSGVQLQFQTCPSLLAAAAACLLACNRSDSLDTDHCAISSTELRRNLALPAAIAKKLCERKRGALIAELKTHAGSPVGPQGWCLPRQKAGHNNHTKRERRMSMA